ncbi:MAG: DUF58 domain-containing protein [Tumebacillaceae bacterium]
MTALLWIATLIGLIYGYSRFWNRETTGKIILTVRAEDNHLTDGDIAVLWFTLENRSWLPIPWLELLQRLPEGMQAHVMEQWKDEIVFRTFLLPRQRVQRRYEVRCARGLHKFDKADVQYGDGVGLRAVGAQLEARETVLVRPRLLEELDLTIRLTELVGEKSVVRWYQEDTSRLQGVRTYQMGDPYRHIHWAATARTGGLMVKQFETTSETDYYVVMNQQFFDPYWTGTIRAVVEHQCKLAATLLRQADEQGYLTGLYSNAGWSGIGGLHVPVGRAQDHFEVMLQSLGAILPRPTGPFADLLQSLRGRLGDRSTIMMFTAYWSPEIALAVEQLRSEGHHIVLVAYGNVAVRLNGLSPSIRVVPIELEEQEEPAISGEEVPA